MADYGPAHGAAETKENSTATTTFPFSTNDESSDRIYCIVGYM